MDQPELGKNEEEQQDNTSSAELSENETAATPQGVEESPTEIDEAEEQPTAEITSDEDESAAAETDDTDEDAETAIGAEEAEEAESAVDAEDAEEEEGPEEAGGLRRGQVIKGTISRTTPNEIYVDLGEGREGIVTKREVEMMSAKMLEKMQEGQEIHVYIVNPSNHREETVLSINHAQEELDWRKAEEYLENKQVYDGKIGGYNKGGLIVRFGRLRGFVPQSQISDKRMIDIEGETPEEKYSGMVGKQISVKVMEVDRSRNRLILSERAAMREVRQRRKEALITELEVGEVREGRVVSLENFGAFVDIGGAEGLVHITELSWKHVTHPRQVLDVGQEVMVKVISVDEDQNRIGLSIKQLKADPWDELATEFGTGALIKATVTKLTKFGAFARVEALPAIEGLIHISELSDERVEHPKDVVNKGDKLTLRVVKVDIKNRRLGLSLRRVNSPEFLDEDLRRAYREQEQRKEVEEEEQYIPQASGGPDDDEDISDIEEAGTAQEPEVIGEEAPKSTGGADVVAGTAEEPVVDAEEVPTTEAPEEDEDA